MSRALRLLTLAVALLGLSCSGDDVASPEPDWYVLQLGEDSIGDGSVLLHLEVYLAPGWSAEGPYPPTGLLLQASVENQGAASIRYDGGGCGCPPLSLRVERRDGGSCGIPPPRPLCPCWTETLWIEPGNSLAYAEAYGQGTCLDASSDAVARFGYSVEEGGEWVGHALEVRVPIGTGTPLIR